MTSGLRMAAILAALATTACAAKPIEKPMGLGPVETGGGSLTAARQYLEGRWSLVSYQIFPAGQPPIQLSGNGTLSYDEFGNMDIQIRVEPATADTLERAGITSDQGVISTKGRTAVDMQARTLTYVLTGQPTFVAPSGPLALNLPRHWAVDGGMLTLTTKGADGRILSEGRWQKLQ
jgi:hypothetical protein